MTPKEHKAFQICIGTIKNLAIVNQSYEFAVLIRDIQKELYIGRLDTIDWVVINSFDSLKYYEKVKKIVDKYSTDKNIEEVNSSLRELLSVIRQELYLKFR